MPGHKISLLVARAFAAHINICINVDDDSVQNLDIYPPPRPPLDTSIFALQLCDCVFAIQTKYS